MIHEDSIPLDVWEKYYGNELPDEKCVNTTCNFTSNFNSFYVYASVFEDDQDGVIVVENQDINPKFLHSNCFFKDSSRNGHGSGVCFICKGSIAQRRFCATNMSIFENEGCGMFSYTNLVSETSNINTITDCSVYLCSQIFDIICFGSILSTFGNISLLSANITNNEISFYSGFCSIGSGKVKFSLFQKCHSYHACLVHSDGEYLYDCCNVINNTIENHEYGIFWIEKSILTIQNCTIRRNSEDVATFYCSNHNSNYYIIINCNIDKFSITGSHTNHTTSAIVNKEDFFHVADILSLNCDNLIPYIREPTGKTIINYVINFLFIIFQKIVS